MDLFDAVSSLISESVSGSPTPRLEPESSQPETPDGCSRSPSKRLKLFKRLSPRPKSKSRTEISSPIPSSSASTPGTGERSLAPGLLGEGPSLRSRVSLASSSLQTGIEDIATSVSDEVISDLWSCADSDEVDTEISRMTPDMLTAVQRILSLLQACRQVVLQRSPSSCSDPKHGGSLQFSELLSEIKALISACRRAHMDLSVGFFSSQLIHFYLAVSGCQSLSGSINTLSLSKTFFLGEAHLKSLEASTYERLEAGITKSLKGIQFFFNRCQLASQQQSSPPADAGDASPENVGSEENGILKEGGVAAPGLSRILAKRNRIQAEFLETEKNYLDTLFKMIQFFWVPLRTASKRSEEQLEAVSLIFTPIKEILDLHILHWDDFSTQVHQNLPLCQAMGPFVKSLGQVYQSFFSVFNECSVLVEGPLKNDILDCEKALIKQVPSQSDSRPVTKFDSLLIGVVQRLPRYVLLLSRLAEVETPENVPSCRHSIDLIQSAIVAIDANTPAPKPVIKHHVSLKKAFRKRLTISNTNGI